MGDESSSVAERRGRALRTRGARRRDRPRARAGASGGACCAPGADRVPPSARRRRSRRGSSRRSSWSRASRSSAWRAWRCSCSRRSATQGRNTPEAAVLRSARARPPGRVLAATRSPRCHALLRAGELAREFLDVDLDRRPPRDREVVGGEVPCVGGPHAAELVEQLPEVVALLRVGEVGPEVLGEAPAVVRTGRQRGPREEGLEPCRGHRDQGSVSFAKPEAPEQLEPGRHRRERIGLQEPRIRPAVHAMQRGGCGRTSRRQLLPELSR